MDTVTHVLWGEKKCLPNVYEWKLKPQGRGFVLSYRQVGTEPWYIFVDSSSAASGMCVNAKTLADQTLIEAVIR